MTRPKRAKTVVYRHPCACASASRPLGAGEEPEHRFDVDGAPFPWHIHPEGPTFTRLLNNLYRIDVTIYGILRDRHEFPSESFSDSPYGPLLIAGREFPWDISGDGISYHRAGTLASVRLGFFAASVDTDGPVTDLRDTTGGNANVHGDIGRFTADCMTPNEVRDKEAAR